MSISREELLRMRAESKARIDRGIQQARQIAGVGLPRPARARHVAGKMNRLEEAYAQHLECQKMAGVIRDWRWEPMKLRLADRTYYDLDFLVIAGDDAVEVHEVKGHWEDDARVKIKVAAEQFPWFRFRAIQRVRKEWQVEMLPPHEAIQ